MKNIYENIPKNGNFYIHTKVLVRYVYTYGVWAFNNYLHCNLDIFRLQLHARVSDFDTLFCTSLSGIFCTKCIIFRKMLPENVFKNVAK